MANWNYHPPSFTAKNFLQRWQNQQQSQVIQQQPQASNTNSTTSGPLPPPKPVWKYFKDLEICREDNGSWRACVCSIDEKPFVCISRWYWGKSAEQWFPSSRQINLPKKVFLQMIEKMDELSDAIEEVPDASTGNRYNSK